MLRLKLLSLLPFLSRWIEVAPACCGMCPTCIGTAATTLLVPAAVAGKEQEAD
jgi:hypothetical protein